MLLNLQDPFIRLTGCHPQQTGGYLVVALPRGNNHCQFSDVPNWNRAPGPRQGGNKSRGVMEMEEVKKNTGEKLGN